MDFAEILKAFTAQSLDQSHRPILLRWGADRKLLEQILVIQRLDLTEGLCSGIEGHLTCLSTRADLPPHTFLGLPVSVQLVTDNGKLQTINGLVTDIRAGQSDGSLACYQLTLRDALSVLEKRNNTRIFRSQSVPEIIDTLLKEWRERSPALAQAFDFDLTGLDASQYPARETTLQHNETDADFIRRLCRREGIAWYIKAGKPGAQPPAGDDTPVHTLVFIDTSVKLPESGAGTIRYHRDAATEQRDAITLWSAESRLSTGSVRRASWDYKTGKSTLGEQTSLIDQGEAGNDIARLLSDNVIETPHAGDTWGDHERLSKLRMLAHELRAASIHGAGGVRDMPVGHTFRLTGHPSVDHQTPEQQQFVVIALRHRAENNFPKDINQRVQALFAASRWQLEDPSGNNESATRYNNQFTCVQRDTPLTPVYEPRLDLPPMHPITALVVGPEGEEVHCDELGRIKIQLQGLDPADHAHAQGAGTSDSERDSAWVRVSSAWAGNHYGHDSVPRIGMEVVINFINGDPDKMLVTGIVHSGPNMPATFSHVGGLPGNRYLSGVKTQEIKGKRYNQLRFDDTPGEISSQLASEDAHSQLNLGHLTHPRDDGQADQRGHGFELRSDLAGAIRAAQGLLITTDGQPRAQGETLARQELIGQLEAALAIAQQLAELATTHEASTADRQPAEKLAQRLKDWQHPGGAPAIAISAPAGLALASAEAITAASGTTLDLTAAQDAHLSTGRQLLLHAGQGLAAFAHKAGMKLIAAAGKVSLQAQSDEMELISAKRLRLVSLESLLIEAGKSITLRIAGAQIALADGKLTLSAANGVEIQAPHFNFGQGGGGQADLPDLPASSLATDERFIIHNDQTGEGVADRAYKATLADGQVIEGVTDAQGRTDLPAAQAIHLVNLVLL